jgi:hypothetical protein
MQSLLHTLSCRRGNGTTHWRLHPSKNRGLEGAAGASQTLVTVLCLAQERRGVGQKSQALGTLRITWGTTSLHTTYTCTCTRPGTCDDLFCFFFSHNLYMYLYLYQYLYLCLYRYLYLYLYSYLYMYLHMHLCLYQYLHMYLYAVTGELVLYLINGQVSQEYGGWR